MVADVVAEKVRRAVGRLDADVCTAAVLIAGRSDRLYQQILCCFLPGLRSLRNSTVIGMLPEIRITGRLSSNPVKGLPIFPHALFQMILVTVAAEAALS